MTINTAVITATIATIINVYFFFSSAVSGLVGCMPTWPNVLRLNKIYQTNPKAIPIAAIKKPPWKLFTSKKFCKIIGEMSAPKLTDM